MAFISVAEELTKKSSTGVENKFIIKYLAELEPVSVKVYLYALFLAQNGLSGYTLEDFAKKLKLTEEAAKDYFAYLEEFELLSITSYSPFEVRILDCENYYGKPKKLHPEKFQGLYEEIQTIVSGRMISQDEFREYLILLEECDFERNALVMIVNYCVSLKGEKIAASYIKKVARNFYDDGIITAKRIEERLSSYTASTPALIKIFNACKISRRPEVEDGNKFESWKTLGFCEESIVCAVKCFKVKTIEKLDGVINELYKNKKFDVKEIEDYRKTRDSLYETSIAVAKSLGIFVSDPTPYVENYINVWYGYGFDSQTLVKIANYCFLCGRNSFDSMNDFVTNLYDDAFVDDESVEKLLERLAQDDKFIKKVLTVCGLTRKIISYDRQALVRWRDWGFSDKMILKAAELSADKNNPIAFMNSLLSQWKNSGIFDEDEITKGYAQTAKTAKRSVTAEWQSTIEKLNSAKD